MKRLRSFDDAGREEKRKWEIVNFFFDLFWWSCYSIVRAKNHTNLQSLPFSFRKGKEEREEKQLYACIYETQVFVFKFSTFLVPRAWWCAKKRTGERTKRKKKKKKTKKKRIYKRNNARLIKKLTYHSIVLSNVVY